CMLDLALPPLCAACREPVEGRGLCPTCWSKLSFLTRPFCSDRLDLAPIMGRWLSQAGRELLAEADALVPVPLHWRRLWARRSNQSAMLAAPVSSQTGVPVASGALKRVKPTAQQVGLSRT